MADSDAEAGSPLLPCASLLPLTLDGVRECSSDPFWRRVRCALLLSLSVLWVAMLASAAVGASAAPPCHAAEAARTRRAAVGGPLLYRVDAGAFDDGSGDGGLRGLISRLDYLVELGVNMVCLSSIYKSPNKNFGHDVEDFKAVNPNFGTMEIFKDLVHEMNKRGLKLVLDLVPNHTSEKHIWFQKSIARSEPYTDYYIWAAPSKFDDEGNPVPPNNWISTTGGSAWEFNDQRKEFYLHQFSRDQPDLNFHNEKVLQEFLEILRFWLDVGVHGFSLDAVPYLLEDSQLRDEPLIGNTDLVTSNATSYESIDHIYTHGLIENMEILQALKEYMIGYSSRSNGEPRVLMTGFYVNETVNYYVNTSKPLVDLLYNFLLITHLNSSSSAHDVMNTISMWLDNKPNGMNATWAIGNPGYKRVAERFGLNMVDGMNMIVLLLPGIAITYWGEEIGMQDSMTVVNNSFENNSEMTAWKSSSPIPMEWNMTKNAVFHSPNITQLLSTKSYPFVNAKAQEAGDSHLNVYKQLSKAREEPAIKFGHLEMKVLGGSVFTFVRHEPGFPAYLVAVNWSEERVLVDFGTFDGLSESATVYVQSTESPQRDADVKDIHAVNMEPKEGLVLIFKPKLP